MHNKLNHRNFSHWIFDLDNTLYPEDDDIHRLTPYADPKKIQGGYDVRALV